MMASPPERVATESNEAVARPPAATISSTTGGGHAPIFALRGDAKIVDHDGRTAGGEFERVTATEAAARSGNDRYATGKVYSFHPCPYLPVLGRMQRGETRCAESSDRSRAA